ncbi:proline dehydrogenase family protein [Terribacillus sp. FSL K6-0262]|uniref:proline dehydrogenase family protein n=1 Tax=Terribacillus sp. FSL K6-0262 TaxID=2921447 RepID=UPI0030EC573B
MEALSRNFFLYLSKNQPLNKLANLYGIRMVKGKIVGGISFDQAIPFIRKLNEDGMSVTVDHLGEYVADPLIAVERAGEAVAALEMIKEVGLDAQVSLKLTSLGLDISEELVRLNLRRILTAADRLGVMVTIDMEDSERCQRTLDLFQELKAEYQNVSTVIQAYLYRSNDDLDMMAHLQPFIRLVKGAYKEPKSVAFQEKRDVDGNYRKLIAKQLDAGSYTAIATHDDRMVSFAKHYALEKGIGKDKFEFQILYGMRQQLQQELVRQGYKVRIYLPYGDDWYGYFMRRLAERPANIAFAFKGMTKK